MALDKTDLILGAGVAFGAWYFFFGGKEKLAGASGLGGALGAPIFELQHPDAQKVSGGYILDAPLKEQVSYWASDVLQNIQKSIIPKDNILPAPPERAGSGFSTVRGAENILIPVGGTGISPNTPSVVYKGGQGYSVAPAQAQSFLAQKSAVPASSVGLTGTAATLWNSNSALQSVKLASPVIKTTLGVSVNNAQIAKNLNSINSSIIYK